MQLLFAKTVQFMRGLSPDVTKSVRVRSLVAETRVNIATCYEIANRRLSCVLYTIFNFTMNTTVPASDCKRKHISQPLEGSSIDLCGAAITSNTEGIGFGD